MELCQIKLNKLFILLTLTEVMLLMFIFETHYTVMCAHLDACYINVWFLRPSSRPPLLAAVIGVCIVYGTGTSHGFNCVQVTFKYYFFVHRQKLNCLIYLGYL